MECCWLEVRGFPQLPVSTPLQMISMPHADFCSISSDGGSWLTSAWEVTDLLASEFQRPLACFIDYELMNRLRPQINLWPLMHQLQEENLVYFGICLPYGKPGLVLCSPELVTASSSQPAPLAYLSVIQRPWAYVFQTYEYGLSLSLPAR